MLFDFSRLGEKDRYKILSFTVVPRPIAWVVTLSASGRLNAAPFSFFNVMCSDPPIVTLGISASGGRCKDTLRHIEDTGEFVVNLVPSHLLEQMNVTAIEFGPDIDEIAESGLTTVPSTFVKPGRIEASPVALECERFQVTRMESGQAIVLGKVLGVHVADDAVLDAEKCYIDTPKLDLVGRMNGLYLRTDAVFPLDRINVEQWMRRRAAKGESKN